MTIQNINTADRQAHQQTTNFVIAEDVIMRQAQNREGPIITEDVVMRQQDTAYVIAEDLIM